MSDVDPTPLTPVTIGDRLGWWRGDLNARLDTLSLQLATQHTELLAAINAIGDGVTLAQLLAAVQAGASSSGATEATSAAILAAIGELATYPAGWTVRALLAQLQTTLDTAPTGPPPTSGNTDPYGCTYPYLYEYRCDLMATGATQTMYGVDYDIYYVSFVRIANWLETANSGMYAFIDQTRTSPITCCLTWNFTGYDTDVSNQMRYNFCSSDTISYLSISNLDSPRVGPTGVMSFTLRPEPSNGYCALFFGMKTGVALPISDVWFHVGDAPPM